MNSKKEDELTRDRIPEIEKDGTIFIFESLDDELFMNKLTEKHKKR